MTSTQHPPPPSTSSSVTLTEAVPAHPDLKKKADDAGSTQDLEAHIPQESGEASSSTDKPTLSSLRKHVLLALYAMVGYNLK